jgi:hypothetical protein
VDQQVILLFDCYRIVTSSIANSRCLYWIPDPDYSNKREGGEKFVVLPFFCSHKYHKIENYFIFELVKKKFGPKDDKEL